MTVLVGLRYLSGIAVLLALFVGRQTFRVRVHAGRTPETASDRPRVVFALTTIKKRVEMVQPVLDQLVEGQTFPPDAVYLALPPDVGELPEWLENYDASTKRPGVLKVLRMEADYGPASKLLAALREGGLAKTHQDAIVIYGDDDVLYGNRIVEQHFVAQRGAVRPTAFGTRKIGVGSGEDRQELLEATGTISLRASAVPEATYRVLDSPPTCFLSDDYWIARHLTQAGVQLELLPDCVYDFNSGRWPESCGTPFETVPHIENIDALSQTRLHDNGEVLHRSGGDWREQLQRYERCGDVIQALPPLTSADE
eukprot:TRINITY_DN30106_c0_g2_i1.p1 TRINITY_DN30106_c0_g2~~TRINITY_DN30106_c0_g2_i1.p1  ORF type:complete len:311 (-),score=74.55 TRINITY_DN30106_c0_g2_i1:439-1371(-)